MIKANIITKDKIIDTGVKSARFHEALGEIISMCRSAIRPLKQYNGCVISFYDTEKENKIISQRRIYSIDEREILLTLQFDEKDIQRMI